MVSLRQTSQSSAPVALQEAKNIQDANRFECRTNTSIVATITAVAASVVLYKVSQAEDSVFNATNLSTRSLATDPLLGVAGLALIISGVALYKNGCSFKATISNGIKYLEQLERESTYKKIIERGGRNARLVPARIFRPPLDRTFSIPEPARSKEVYELPIRAVKGVRVTQGPINQHGNRTHSWYNCLYAIDFMSLQDGPPGEILAIADGNVVNLNLEGNSSDALFAPGENAGGGFGKWVAIEHKNGESSFYAHLSKIIVKIGDHVTKNQVIGTEGVSGQAGHRHLHFSIQRCIQKPWWKSHPLDYSYYCTIPYLLRCTDAKSKEKRIFDIREFQNIDSIPSDQTLPHLE